MATLSGVDCVNTDNVSVWGSDEVINAYCPRGRPFQAVQGSEKKPKNKTGIGAAAVAISDGYVLLQQLSGGDSGE